MEYSTMSEIVVGRVKDDILSGKLRPGVRLDQGQLTEKLGVSLSPLREAFRRLEAQGYITIVPHRGAYVKEFSQGELEDIYLVRRNLEGLAAELAADRLTDADIQRLRDLLGKMQSATRQEKHRELMRLNRELHFTTKNACGRNHLLEILADLWNRSSRYRNLQDLLLDRAEKSLEEHKEILEECAKGSKRRVAKAIRFNIEECRKSLTKSQ